MSNIKEEDSSSDDLCEEIPYLAPILSKDFHHSLKCVGHSSDTVSEATVIKRRRTEVNAPEENGGSPFQQQLRELFTVCSTGEPTHVPPIAGDLLRRYFHISSGAFRPRQAEVCFSVLKKKSILAVCPTGWGKSMCYLFPMLVHRLYFQEALNSYEKSQLANDASPLVMPESKFCVVVSPLISLMNDQASKILQFKPLACAVLSAQTGQDGERRIMDNLRSPHSSLDAVFISPEKLIGCWALRSLLVEQPHRLAFICIDEVHCVSKWAFNFRPSFLCLHKIFEWSQKKEGKKTECHGSPFCFLCLTATASDQVRRDLESIFRIEHTVECTDLYRSNLVLTSRHLVNEEEEDDPPTTKVLHDAITQAVYELPKPLLLYVRSRVDADEISSVLNAKVSAVAVPQDGLRAVDKAKEGKVFVRTSPVPLAETRSLVIRSFHAGQTRELRQKTQQQFIRDEIDVLVATVAFGMGIDKPNIRSVVHAFAPSSLENYVQEIGRAGRDGMKSYCTVLYNPYEYFFLRSSLLSSYVSQKEIAAVIREAVHCPTTEYGEELMLIPVEKLSLQLQVHEEIMETLLYMMVLQFPKLFRGIKGKSPVGYKVTHFQNEISDARVVTGKGASKSSGIAQALQQVAASDAVFDLCRREKAIESVVKAANQLQLSLEDLQLRLNDLVACGAVSLSRLSPAFVICLQPSFKHDWTPNMEEEVVHVLFEEHEKKLRGQVEGLKPLFSVLRTPSHERIDRHMRSAAGSDCLDWKPPRRQLTKMEAVSIASDFVEGNRTRLSSKHEAVRALLGVVPKSQIKRGKFAGAIPLAQSWYTKSPHFGALKEFDFAWVLTVVSASDLPD